MHNHSSKHAKYYTVNPISNKLVTDFFKDISELYKSLEVESIFDAGCGEGFVLSTLNKVKEIKKCAAIDLDPAEVEDASKNLPFCNVQQGTVYNIPFPDNSFDLVICSEVLEHLETPETALKELYRVSNKYAILSVPREPVWRMLNMARLKYWNDFGNTPGHLNHWNKNSFKEFIHPFFKAVETRTPLPWTMVLCEKK